MDTHRHPLWTVAAACALALTACKPAQDPVERPGRNIDRTAKKIADQTDKSAEKPKEAASGVKY